MSGDGDGKTVAVFLPLISAGVVELADSTDLGSVTPVVCGFKSRRPHQKEDGLLCKPSSFWHKFAAQIACLRQIFPKTAILKIGNPL